MKKANSGILLKLAILLIALQEVGTGAATPALGIIQAAMPDVNPILIQNIASITYLTIVVGGLAYSWFAKVMRKRVILYIAVFCFIIGGIAPAFLNNIYLILFFRAVVGFGVGLMYPMANDYVVDYYDGNEKQKMIGWAFAISMFGGIIFQQLGGSLAAVNWHYTFFSYLLGILFFAIPLLFLPEPPKKAELVKGTAQEKAKVPARQWVLSVLNALWNVGFAAVVTNAAIIIITEGVGTGGQIGTAFSIMTLGGFVGGFFFSHIRNFLKGFSLLACYWVVAIGFFVFVYAGTSINMIYFSMAIIGVGLGFAGSNFFNKTSDIVPYAAAGSAFALLSAFNGLGGFFSPFILTALTGAFGMAPGRPSLLLGAIILSGLGVVAFIFDRATPKIPESVRPTLSAK
ncbi:MFS transporter [Dehalobacter sp. DCM]|uniref:MFS transporter n=1 Tax=Dehalobacter sp. DCM TaxID=2907827 RepID=UPI003081C0A4|nr:MFS transporter [Dehalobacter sp. DCM]